MRSSSSGVALLPCDAASEPAAAGAGLTGGVLGPFQKRTRRAKRRPATRAANSTQSWRRMLRRFFVQRWQWRAARRRRQRGGGAARRGPRRRRAAMQSTMWAGLAAEQFRAAGGEESLVDGAIVCSNATNLLQASCTPSKPQKLQIACSQLAACKTLARTRNPMHASPQAFESVLCACARPCAPP